MTDRDARIGARHSVSSMSLPDDDHDSDRTPAERRVGAVLLAVLGVLMATGLAFGVREVLRDIEPNRYFSAWSFDHMRTVGGHEYLVLHDRYETSTDPRGVLLIFATTPERSVGHRIAHGDMSTSSGVEGMGHGSPYTTLLVERIGDPAEVVGSLTVYLDGPPLGVRLNGREVVLEPRSLITFDAQVGLRAHSGAAVDEIYRTLEQPAKHTGVARLHAGELIEAFFESPEYAEPPMSR
jgi:hypothetical protein